MRKAQGKGFFRGLYKVAEFITFFCLCLFFLIGAGRCATAKYVYPVKYKTEVFAYADMYGLSRALVFAMIKTESGFDHSARSDAGAVGLMQITEETGKYIAEKLGAVSYDLSDPETNVSFGCFYIKYLLTRFKNENTALAAYNAGEGNVAIWLEDKSCSEDGKTLKYIPFAETRAYLRKIWKSFEKYKKLYGKTLDK